MSVPEADLAARRPVVGFWAMFAWLGLQILALWLAAMRVPFSAKFPTPADQFAMHEMLIVQTLASTLLFPMLFRSATSSAMTIAAAPLMIQLSAVLASMVEFERLVGMCVYMGLWLVGLALWSAGLRGGRARMWGVAAFTAITAGGAILAYLEREFGAARQTFEWAPHGWMGPIMGGITILEVGPKAGTAWVFVGVFLTGGAIAAGLSHWRGRRGDLKPS